MNDDRETSLPLTKGKKKRSKTSSRKGEGDPAKRTASNEAPLTINDFKDTSGKLLTEETAVPRPCILEALGSAASGGFIGALYGFGTKVVFFKGKGRFAAARGEAFSTGKAFASFGGLYALTSCIAKRLRNKDDLISTASAGAATGFVMGIQGGLQSGLSCALFTCAISVFIDKMQPQEATASEQFTKKVQRRSACSLVRPSQATAASSSQRNLISCILCPALPLPAASQYCRRMTSTKLRGIDE